MSEISRPPVVTILGHVDHGKTTLLDYIRSSSVASSEVGGITQAIGAYQVKSHDKVITFIDTPGHSAFEKMRSRGAKVADIAVLVVAADDGIMPQTIEAIKHILEAKIPMIVAVNKIDLPGINLNAQIEKIKRQLADNEVLVEQYGGDVPIVQISAVTGRGVDELLTTINLLSDIYEFKGDTKLPAQGVVIEAKIDKFKGPIATLLIRNGTLNKGDVMEVGNSNGKVRGMFDFQGKSLSKAGPSTPVEVLGLESVPQVGAKLGEEVVSKSETTVFRNTLLDKLKGEEDHILNVIMKSDNQGSLEAIEGIIEDLNQDKSMIKIIHSGTGDVNDMDIERAASSKGIVIGFNVKVSSSAAKLAETQNVLVRSYKIIYELAEEMKDVVEGMLVPGKIEEVFGRAQIIAEFPYGKNDRIAGCHVLDGAISKGPKVRVLRDGDIIGEGKIKILKKVKEDVTRVEKGGECGLMFDHPIDFQVGDFVECFRSL